MVSYIYMGLGTSRYGRMALLFLGCSALILVIALFTLSGDRQSTDPFSFQDLGKAQTNDALTTATPLSGSQRQSQSLGEPTSFGKPMPPGGPRAPQQPGRPPVNMSPQGTFQTTAMWQQEQKQKQQALKQAKGVNMPSFDHFAGSFRFLHSVYALPDTDFAQDNGDEVIGRNAGFVFLRSDPNETLPPGALPAVALEANGTLGAVTGKLTIKVAPNQLLSDFTDEYNLRELQSYPHIRSGVFETSEKDESKLVALLNSIRVDPRVERAHLIVTYSRVVPH